MRSLQEVVEILNRHKDELRKKHKIKRIRIFGSYAEGKQEKSSDIDVIVDFEELPTFIEFIRIQEELEKLLNVKVDLLTEEEISPFIKPYIKEVVTV